MKMNKLAMAVAASTAMMAGTAQALIPGAEGNGNERLDIYMSGATALDKQLKFYFTDLCQAGTLDIFTDNISKPQGKAFSAYYCVLGPAEVSGLSKTYNVMLHKRSRGGSAWGVGPVAGAIEMEQMDITDANCDFSTVDGTDNGNDVYECSSSNTFLARSDAGISDVEPQLFNYGPNLIDVNDDPSISAGDPGTVPVSDALLANMDIAAMNATTFGIVVTKDLRDALQDAQGLTVGSEEVSEMPSLSRDLIGSILGGVRISWDEVKVPGSATGIFTNAAGTGYAATRSQINVCRRVEGSGTQAQANAVFNNVGCGVALNPATDNTPTSTLDGTGAGVDTPDQFGLGLFPLTAIHENSGSGDVTDCMSALQNYDDGAGNSVWGIGIQSLEKADDDFRFIRINGVAPVLESVAANEYLDYVTTSIQWRTGSVDGIDAPAGDTLAVLQSIRTKASNPTTIAALNSSLQSKSAILDGGSKANIGALALFYKGFAPSAPFDSANPVSCASREGVSGTLPPNSCNIPVVYRTECSGTANK